jgi:glycosyltransferase involved in cell wall biosynthesis
MLFSVVIPTYNRAHLLPQALESVFAQEEKDFEILIVDDGSTDDTEAVLARYEGRVRVFRQKNSGPAVARNLGIENARGDYVAFLDSDDVWFPWTLAVHRSVIEKHGTPTIIEGTHVEFSTEDGPPALAEILPVEYPAPDYLASPRGGLWPSGVAIRTEALRAVGGFPTHAFNAEDSDLWLRLGTRPGFVHVSAPPAFAYRRHAESAVGSLRKTCDGTIWMIGRERDGVYPGGASRRLDRLRILTIHTRPLSVSCARRGLMREAFDIYRRTLGWNLRLCRFRYLIVLPCLALWHGLGAAEAAAPKPSGKKS